MTEFQKVTSIDQLQPGQMKQVEVNGQDVCIANVDGEICAISNVCAHHGGPLAEGTLDGDIVTCPWHGWKYSMKTGVSVVAKTVKVDSFEVKVEGNDVLVSKEPKA